jgi:FtsZ-binding cell division protein ZapB
VLPVQFEGEVKAVIELASFSSYSEIHLAFLDQLTESIGVALNTIAATMRTETLLNQAQALAAELQSRQEDLTGTNKQLEQQATTSQASEDLLKRQQEELRLKNEELQEKAKLLAGQKAEVEAKNATDAGLEVQVGVPGQYVARAADAPEQSVDPGPHAGR